MEDKFNLFALTFNVNLLVLSAIKIVSAYNNTNNVRN